MAVRASVPVGMRRMSWMGWTTALWLGMATSPLAQSSSQESKAISVCSTNHQHVVQPTDVGLLILSSDRSTLDPIQPQFLSHASTCCGASSPRVLGLQFGMAGMMG